MSIKSMEVIGKPFPGSEKILSPEAMNFISKLVSEFSQTRLDLLKKREERQKEINEGKMPDFLNGTENVRQGDWKIAPVPKDLRDRRVEITGPTDRKMIINALNSGASVFMADFEDSNAPTWKNIIQGQINLCDTARGAITFISPEGKQYRLKEKIATLMVRPRGWHLEERHILMNGSPVSASLLDFGLFFFHNASTLLERGTGPYFYLPKMESHLEARLWNDVFTMAQGELGIPKGTIKATVLIETILAAFEMDEILHELKDHSAGLNCGRWDYIFSVIKKFRNFAGFVMPDRVQVTMTSHFLRSYSQLLIKTCHKRNAHAMGGMAAQIPIKNDPKANEDALAKVRADKEREAGDGHDGTWVAHPDLVPIAKEIFDSKMREPNQVGKKREDVNVSSKDLLAVPEGEISEKGLRLNIDVSLQYLEAWLRGTGCVPIYHLMEDAATAEISRSQVWQWMKHGSALSDGRIVTLDLVRAMLAEEVEKLKSAWGEIRFQESKLQTAKELFDQLVSSREFPEFLTLPAYKYLE